MARETDIRSGIAGEALTPFQELLVAEKTPVIVLNGSFPLSDIRDDQQTSGTGSVSDTDAEFKVNHASDGDFARLASSSRGRYNPGSLGHFGIGIRLSKSQSELPSSGDWSIRWGYFDMEHNSGTNQETVNKQLFDLLEEYVNSNDEWTFTIALENIRQKIGRPIVHVYDEEILQYLRQWKSKKNKMEENPLNHDW